LQRRSASGQRRRPGRVLVIEDDATLGWALGKALGGECVVTIEGRADVALLRLRSGERYDLVLCNLMMPWMDGIEFHRCLSAIMPEEAVRIVFMTGDALTARVEAFCRRVPNLLLEKPLDLDDLRALVGRRVLGRVPLAAGADAS
jgi:CheY-like chemotaxis protein